MAHIALTFTDTDNTPLPTHDPKWVAYSGVANTDVVIRDNAARRNEGTDGRFYYDENLGAQSFVVEWDHKFPGVAGGRGGIIINANAASLTNGYLFRSFPGSGVWQLYKITNGTTFSLLDSTSFTFSNSTTYAGRIERNATDNTIVCKVNGVVICQATDADYKTNDRVGIRLSDGLNVDIDNIVTSDLASGPTLSSVPATAFPGQSRTVTGTGFGATQGAGGLTIGGVAQPPTAWSDTSITFTTVQGNNKYEAGKTLEVTTDAATTVSDTIELVADTANGFGYVDMSSPNTTDESSVAFGATPTVVTGDQFEWEDFNNLGNLTIDAQGFVTNVDTEGTFRGRFWDATDSTWGAVETFEASVPGEEDTWPFGKGINPAATKNWTWGRRHPKTNMRVRIYK